MPPCVAIVMQDKSMKQWFSEPCVHGLKGLKTTLHSAAVVRFSEKWKKMFFRLSRQ